MAFSSFESLTTGAAAETDYFVEAGEWLQLQVQQLTVTYRYIIITKMYLSLTMTIQ